MHAWMGMSFMAMGGLDLSLAFGFTGYQDIICFLTTIAGT